MKKYFNPNASLYSLGEDFITSSADDGLREDLAVDDFD